MRSVGAPSPTEKEGNVLEKKRIAVVGFGHVGCGAVEALEVAPDLELAGVVLQDEGEIRRACCSLGSVPVVRHLAELEKVDAALLAVPSRCVPKLAPPILETGVATVDCYDIHGDPLMTLRATLDPIAREHGTAAVISAGWDPGTDSVVRTLLEALVPRGITYTNFGPGMSMGHTVVVKGFEGVEDALSLTIPKGCGLHKRYVYLKTRRGTDFDALVARISQDPYFAHDEVHFFPCEDVQALVDTGHAVHLERRGSAGKTHNQKVDFLMSVTNPAATGQVLVSAARAVLRQRPGAYTLPEIPPVDFLPGDRESLLHRLI